MNGHRAPPFNYYGEGGGRDIELGKLHFLSEELSLHYASSKIFISHS